MGPEVVATTYVQLLARDDERAALALMQANCPYVHKAGFASIRSVVAEVGQQSTADAVTVSVRITGRVRTGAGTPGPKMTHTQLLDIVREEGLWVVKCPTDAKLEVLVHSPE
jgi:hypothetical protein